MHALRQTRERGLVRWRVSGSKPREGVPNAVLSRSPVG
jgi:hypothetical protein